MKKVIIYYSLLLLVITGCGGEQHENKKTLAQIIEMDVSNPQNTKTADTLQSSQVEDSSVKQKLVEESQEKENEQKSDQSEDQREDTKKEKNEDPQEEQKKVISLKIGKKANEENESKELDIEQIGEEKKNTINGQKNKQKTEPESKQDKEALSNDLGWEEFFDNEDQTTPSEKFWDLKGQQVTINGFMGEVLSLDGGWFLLIPAPGAECPFDNGDESYWNKIMIVFVKDKKELRFTSGPLHLTGRLDVGIKVDESNYKTMFRLYDATFEKMK
jgi:hypothetical protein